MSSPPTTATELMRRCEGYVYTDPPGCAWSTLKVDYWFGPCTVGPLVRPRISLSVVHAKPCTSRAARRELLAKLWPALKAVEQGLYPCLVDPEMDDAIDEEAGHGT